MHLNAGLRDLGLYLRLHEEVGSGTRGWWWCRDAYLIDPVIVGRHTGEDHWLLGDIAAASGAKAHDAVHLP